MGDVRTGGQQVVGPQPADGPVAADDRPVLIGGRAAVAEPDAMSADGDAVHAWFDRLGRLVVVDGHPGEATPTSVVVTASNSEILAAPGVGLALYVCAILAGNTSATFTILSLKEGSGGATRLSMGLASSGGGFAFRFKRWWKLPANTALVADLSQGVTDVRVNVEHFTAA